MQQVKFERKTSNFEVAALSERTGKSVVDNCCTATLRHLASNLHVRRRFCNYRTARVIANKLLVAYLVATHMECGI